MRLDFLYEQYHASDWGTPLGYSIFGADPTNGPYRYSGHQEV
ncbi:hypothetical protein [Nonomuraea endophytica]